MNQSFFTRIALAVAMTSLPAAAAVGVCNTFFCPGNIVVVVEGNGVNGATSGAFGDNQAGPMTLIQYKPDGTYVNSLVLPQGASAANLPVSGEYGSSSEGTLQLSGAGQYLTVMGYGIDYLSFNGSPFTFGSAPSGALAQSSSLTGTSYTAVPRVVALIDANGNVNSSTGLFNIFDTNNPRSIYTVDGVHMYVSGQGNTQNVPDPDNTGGVYYTTLGSSSATAITGLDTENKAGTGMAAQDTHDVQVYNGQLYVSVDSKEGENFNRDLIGTLGTGTPTTLTGAPVKLKGFGGTGSSTTGKFTITAGTGNGINSVNQEINLSPLNYFFASPTVLYVADGGQPKNDSVTNDSGSTSTLGNGGLQKWVLTSGTWALKYNLYLGLPLVANTAAAGMTGLYAVAGQPTNGGTSVQLYVTPYTINDLDPTSLYTITDTLATTSNPGTSFTKVVDAPADSKFKGVSFPPVTPSGGVTITSSPSGLAFTTTGSGCAPGGYTTPVTLIWTPSSSCTLATAPTQTAPGSQYVFTQWEDGTTQASRVVTAPSTPTTYTATFAATYQLTTSVGTGGGGTVSAGGSYPAGTNAVITATPSAGYYFVNFTGATTSTNNPLTLPINAPTSITANFAAQTTPTITWNAPAAITYATALSATQLNASASVAGTFVYSPPASTVLTAGNNQTLSVTFTPTDTTHYTTANSSTTINVGQATPTVTWNPPAAIIFGSALGSGQLNATASVPGSFAYTPAAGTVLPVGNAQTLSAAFTPTDTVDYTTAGGLTTIDVNPASLPPASPANLVVTRVLTRSGGNVVVQLTIANTGGTAAGNVILTSVKVGSATATPLPQSLGAITAGSSAVATVAVPGSVGASGVASSLTVSATYTGGTVNSSARITLP